MVRPGADGPVELVLAFYRGWRLCRLLLVGGAAVAVGLAGATMGCAGSAQSTLEKAAAQDPMKCERDPTCARGRSSYQDCYRQCVDDPQCVDRCQSVQQQIDSPAGGGPR